MWQFSRQFSRIFALHRGHDWEDLFRSNLYPTLANLCWLCPTRRGSLMLLQDCMQYSTRVRLRLGWQADRLNSRGAWPKLIFKISKITSVVSVFIISSGLLICGDLVFEKADWRPSFSWDADFICVHLPLSWKRISLTCFTLHCCVSLTLSSHHLLSNVFDFCVVLFLCRVPLVARLFDLFRDRYHT